jgi:hypothetical protein
MEDLENAIATASGYRPWNKGKLTGAKSRRCAPNMSGRFGRSSRSRVAFATLPCLIWRSTASFAAVTLSRSRSRMSPRADKGPLPGERYDQIQTSSRCRDPVNDDRNPSAGAWNHGPRGRGPVLECRLRIGLCPERMRPTHVGIRRPWRPRCKEDCGAAGGGRATLDR